jgi:O-antigen ligase
VLWSLSFVALVIGPIVAAFYDPDGLKIALRTWILLASLCGSYAGVEAFVLHRNPLFDWAYHSAPSPLIQQWGVYRATSTLGHPLTNAAFFSTAIPLAIGIGMKERHTGGKYIFAVIPCSIGLLATASRAASLGAIIGTAFTLLLLFQARDDRHRGLLRFCLVLLAFSAVTLLASGGLVERTTSAEANTSYAYRSESFQAGKQLLAASPITGFGPGLGDLAKLRYVNDGHLQAGLENSWMEIAVGSGIPGLLLVISLVTLALRRNVRRKEWGLCGALTVYLFTAATSALLEQQQPYLLLFGLLLAASLFQASETKEDDGSAFVAQNGRMLLT